MENKAALTKLIHDNLMEIHKTPGIREKISLESIPLNPWLIETESGLELHTLLAVKKNDYYVVWAHLAWNLDSNCVKELKALPEKIGIKNHMAIYTKDKITLIANWLQDLATPPSAFEALRSLYTDLGIISAAPANEFANAPFNQIYSKLKKMVVAANTPVLNDALKSLQRNLQREHFSIAVVGEFNRGKSTLVNKMLEKDMLPTNITPTTAILTSIVHGSKDTAVHINANNRVEHLDLTSDRLASIIKYDDGNTDSSGLMLIQLHNNNLAVGNLKLIDTPGTNDTMIKRLALTTEAIAGCDATILVVSALSPISITEKAFLLENILGKRVPNICIVITHLDKVPVTERIELYEYIKLSAQKIAGVAIRVIASESLDGLGKVDKGDVGVNSLWKLLHVWSDASDLNRLRSLQDLNNLNDLCKSMYDFYLIKQTLLNNDESERKELLQQRAQMSQDKIIKYKEMLIMLKKMERSSIDFVITHLADSLGNYMKNCCKVIRKTSDPRKWLENEWEDSFVRPMGNIHKQCCKLVEDKILNDAKYCLQNVQAILEIDTKLELVDAKQDDLVVQDKFDSKMDAENNKIEALKKRGLNMGSLMLGSPIAAMLMINPPGQVAMIIGGAIAWATHEGYGKYIENPKIGERQEIAIDYLNRIVTEHKLRSEASFYKNINQKYSYIQQLVSQKYNEWSSIQKQAEIGVNNMELGFVNAQLDILFGIQITLEQRIMDKVGVQNVEAI